VHGAQSSQGSAPRVRCRRGNNDSPPHSAPGPAERAFTVQPTLLPPRSGICARGTKRARAASPSRSDAQAEHGERPDKPCKRGHTGPNSGHSRAQLLACTTSRFPQESSFSAGCATGNGLPMATHNALISPLYYTTHHSCITRYILHTQYAPHLAGVLPRGGRSLNPPAQSLF
jgi:hypothetical protein